MRQLREFLRPDGDPHIVPTRLRTLDRVLAAAMHSPERERADLSAIRAALAETASPATLPAKSPATLPADGSGRQQRKVVPISSHPRHRPARVDPAPVAAPPGPSGLGHVERLRVAASRLPRAGLALRVTSHQTEVMRYVVAAAFVLLGGAVLIFAAQVLIAGRFGPSIDGPGAMMTSRGAAVPPVATPRPPAAVDASPAPDAAAPTTQPPGPAQPVPPTRKATGRASTPTPPVAPVVPPPPLAPRPTPTTAPPPSHVITIDATALDYTSLWLHHVGSLDTGRVQTVSLRSGAYTLETPAGALLNFGISDSGRLGYDPGLDRMLTGRGGDSLTVTGFPIVVDTSETGYHNTMVSGTGWRAPEPVRTLRLLPGRHWVESPVGNQVQFDVTDTGRVDYPAELDTLLSGRDTGRLTVHGFR